MVSTMSFEELKSFNGRLGDLVHDRPLTMGDISNLIQQGYYLKEGLIGGISYEKKFISIARWWNPYNRDVTLFHEIAHYIFDKELKDKPEIVKECVVEYAARLWRSDPELLQFGILGFGLPPKVYDFSSQEAFPNKRMQEGFVYEVLRDGTN